MDEIPAWNICVGYSNHTVQDMICYDGDVFDKVKDDSDKYDRE